MRSEKLVQWLAKYKFAALILLLGLALMLWPSREGEAQTVEPKQTQTEPQEPDLEMRLEELLSQVEGAGSVQVILTHKTGTEYIYQTDEEREEQTQGSDTRTNYKSSTVLLSADGVQQAVIAQTVYPTYLGAVVLAQGADEAKVCLDIVNAVSSLTGLSADKISVIKMVEQQEE